MRSEHPGCGVEKMYNTLNPGFIGRDKFVDIFMELGYRVKQVKNYVRTTTPTHLKYPNLIEGLCVYKPTQLWQSDITYYYLNGRFYYIVFILDIYTKEIVGFNISDNLRAEANIKALKQAMKGKRGTLRGLIHHSDRGSQYVDKGYLSLLKSERIEVSMGHKAQDNAYAERINGTIKNEYLKRWEIKDFTDLKRKLKKAVNHYNTKRAHYSLPGNIAPMVFTQKLLDLESRQRPKVIVYAEGKPKVKETTCFFDFNSEKALIHVCPIVNRK